MPIAPRRDIEAVANRSVNWSKRSSVKAPLKRVTSGSDE
jgi:hypothetical protein